VSSLLYAPEHWGAYVDARNVGLTVYVPSQYPYESGVSFPGSPGSTGNGTNYFSPLTTLTIGPNVVFEGDIYLIAGDFVSARETIYDLHQRMASPDIFMPLGSTDVPPAGSTISGVTTVGGWTFGAVNVAKVEIMMDGRVDGTASYGSPRPDVAMGYPHAPVNVGFSYPLSTTNYANGPHTLNVRATDRNGNAAIFPDVKVTVSN
jgi:hypothetical protein